MTEGATATFASFDVGYDPADPVGPGHHGHPAAVFPLHGLFP